MAALTHLRDRNPRKATDDFLDLDQDQAAHVLRMLWTRFSRTRPDLAYRVLPLARYSHHKKQADHEAALVAIARTAVRAGLFDLTMTPSRTSTDLFGPLLMGLRPRKALESHGQFYTSPNTAALLADMDAVPPPGSAVCEHLAGTGALVLALAERIRAHGGDPADLCWELVDIDPVATACLAVNTHLWQLGPRVLIGCADSLTGNWQARARYERGLGIEIDRTRALYRLAVLGGGYTSAA
ncbi:SAM-dependent DNA methyltransferase [Nocardiopsis sp. LOL_012]|uniref:SAM-dependent DNA methyltransferase n=1 Tax=Nocardiopsis sp. LOL_012 TaxID=3345409 RepID=UPI003A8AF7A0